MVPPTSQTPSVVPTARNFKVLPGCASLLAALLFPALNPSTVEAQVPHGVFSLAGAGSEVDDAVLADPDVVGISIRQDWAELEQTEGVFDFTFLDSEVQRATAAGKIVLLRINTQASKPDWVTQAVSDAGGTFFTFDKDDDLVSGASSTVLSKTMHFTGSVIDVREATPDEIASLFTQDSGGCSGCADDSCGSRGHGC